MTQAEAEKLYESKFWEGMSYLELATFQLHERWLCMPFDVFHEAVEKALGRTVWAHEFARTQALRDELNGNRPAPTMQEIIDLIPADKRIVIFAEDP